MMELLKKHIHMNRRRGNVTSQMTLDDDFNVPDSMDDVEELIMENGEVKIESVKNPGEKAEISGKLEFRILYRRPGGELTALAGSIPFTETVHMPGLAENDYVQAGWELDDLNVSLINSRKLNVKALVTLELKADEIRDMETASDVKFDGEVEVLKKTLTVAAIAVRRRDTFRVREVLTIPGNDPDAETLLWQDMRLQDVETKPLDGKIHISGDLLVFAVYSAGGGQMPVQCFEETVPFSGDVELTESAEDMIPFITVKLVHRDMELQPDSDGEMREISVDAVMELDIRLYEEEQVELLGDLYALDREAVPETGTVCFDTLAVRNQVKTKIQEKVQLTGRQRILQVCHSDGDVKIDEVQIKEDGIHMDGVLEIRLLYLTADDQAPVGAASEVLPFHLMAAADGLTQDVVYEIEPGISGLTAVMAGGDAVEVKAQITADVLVLKPVCEQTVLSVAEEPLDTEQLKKMPGIIGYVVKPGDSLWKIARMFHTSVERVMELNHLSDSTIRPGDQADFGENGAGIELVPRVTVVRCCFLLKNKCKMRQCLIFPECLVAIRGKFYIMV